jgi:hypothetical protein
MILREPGQEIKEKTAPASVASRLLPAPELSGGLKTRFSCHPQRRQVSQLPGRQILRFIQNWWHRLSRLRQGIRLIRHTGWKPAPPKAAGGDARPTGLFMIYAGQSP